MSTQTNLFAPLGVETAPEKSRPLLEKIQKSFKFIPNLFGVFANSPVLLEGYWGLEGAFDKGSLSAVERSIVLLAASVENSCKYCTAAHSTVLLRMVQRGLNYREAHKRRVGEAGTA